MEPFSKFDSSLTDIIINDCLQLLYLDDVICSISIDLSSYNSDKSGFNSTLERIRLWTESVQFSSSDRVDIRLQKYVEPTTYISGVVELFVTLKLNECHLSNASDFKYFQYALPTFTLNNNIDGEYINSLSNGIEKMIHIYTREKRKDCGVTAKTLVSNSNPLTPNPLIKGVDNTGNICVWPAEGALLCALLRCERYRNLLQGARVLELGGGQAGLAGLGVAAAGLSQEVVISDGNGQCVANQVV